MTTWAGNLVKVARLESGLTQAALARRAGTSQATISAYESGEKSPGLDTLARIVRAAGLDLRVQIVPGDPHDESIARFEQSLPPDVVAGVRERDRALVEQARAESP